MEIKQIKELMTMMERTGIKRLTIKKEGIEVHLEREESKAATYKVVEPELVSDEYPLRGEIALHRANIALGHAPDVLPPVPQSTSPLSPQPKVIEEVPGIYISSPMVGTFYSSPSPDAAPFVKHGERVEKDTIVCIIEAMKVMNEVKAGVSGVITEVLVESGHPVEFGTKLFRVTQ